MSCAKLCCCCCNWVKLFERTHTWAFLVAQSCTMLRCFCSQGWMLGLILSCYLQVSLQKRSFIDEEAGFAFTCTTMTRIEEKLEQGQKQKRREETNSKMLLFWSSNREKLLLEILSHWLERQTDKTQIHKDM